MCSQALWKFAKSKRCTPSHGRGGGSQTSWTRNCRAFSTVAKSLPVKCSRELSVEFTQNPRTRLMLSRQRYSGYSSSSNAQLEGISESLVHILTPCWKSQMLKKNNTQEKEEIRQPKPQEFPRKATSQDSRQNSSTKNSSHGKFPNCSTRSMV